MTNFLRLSLVTDSNKTVNAGKEQDQVEAHKVEATVEQPEAHGEAPDKVPDEAPEDLSNISFAPPLNSTFATTTKLMPVITDIENNNYLSDAENLDGIDVMILSDSPLAVPANTPIKCVTAERMDDINFENVQQPMTTPKKKLPGSPSWSPASKIHTSAGPRPKSTEKKSATPKRKLPTKFWPKAAVNALVAKCLKRKQEVQADKVPVRVWHDISADIAQKGFTYNYEDCRSKYMTLKEFFHGTLLPLKGTIGGVMWSHFDHFLDLHDIPRDCVEEFDFTIGASNAPTETPGNQIWTPQAEMLLLAEYEARKAIFDSTTSGIRHSMLFQEIAIVMQNFDIAVSVKQCTDHMAKLKSDFKKEYDRVTSKGTGQAPSEWPYYDRMLEMFYGTPTLKAPPAVSVGRQVKYTTSGETAVEVPIRTSRTRVPATTKDSASERKVKKQPIYRPLNEVVQAPRTGGLEHEVRLMRESFEQRSEKRLQALLQLVQNTA